MTPRIFRYVVRYDSGVAPRPFDGYCTLAICKPKIRAAATVGDWVIGFRTKSPGDVIYVMQVEEVLSFADYWADKRFRNRRPGATFTPDNIYRPARDGSLEQVPNHVHGATETATDVGGRNVLVSQKFWYFGETSPMISTDLAHLIHASRGHAVDKSRRLDDLEHLVNWLEAWDSGLHGNPVDRSLVNMNALTRGKCLSTQKASAEGVASTARPAPRRCASPPRRR